MLDRVLSNWPLKLLSMALAFAIWVSVTGETRVVQDFQVPVAIAVPGELILASTLPNTATVRLRGSEGMMRRVDRLPMVLSVDLTDADEGNQDVQLSRSILEGIPRGPEVEFIDPDRLSLALDRRLRRQLPVEPVFLGQPPDGFIKYGSSSDPEFLVVEGPVSELESVEVIHTNGILLDRRRSPFTVQVSVAPEGEFVRVLDPSTVQVRVDVDASPVEKSFEDLPIFVTGTMIHSTTVAPDKLNVTLSGPPSLIVPLLPEQIRLVADVTNLAPSVEKQQVEVRVEFVDVPIEDRTRISVKSPKDRTVSVLIGEGRTDI
jgi:YbbR domain-containing protein